MAAHEALDAEIGESDRPCPASGTTRSRNEATAPEAGKASPGKMRMKAAKQRRDAAERMEERRAADVERIREQCERTKQGREKRFEKILEELLAEDELKCGVA